MKNLNFRCIQFIDNAVEHGNYPLCLDRVEERKHENKLSRSRALLRKHHDSV